MDCLVALQFIKLVEKVKIPEYVYTGPKPSDKVVQESECTVTVCCACLARLRFASIFAPPCRMGRFAWPFLYESSRAIAVWPAVCGLPRFSHQLCHEYSFQPPPARLATRQARRPRRRTRTSMSRSIWTSSRRSRTTLSE